VMCDPPTTMRVRLRGWDMACQRASSIVGGGGGYFHHQVVLSTLDQLQCTCSPLYMQFILSVNLPGCSPVQPCKVFKSVSGARGAELGKQSALTPHTLPLCTRHRQAGASPRRWRSTAVARSNPVKPLLLQPLCLHGVVVDGYCCAACVKEAGILGLQECC
jgi:hypothetical protein